MSVGRLRSAMSWVTGIIGIRRAAGRPPDRPATVEEMLPPSRMFSGGNGEFKAIGLGVLAELKASCDLAPHHHVLDVGCGIGRIAIPLTQYLSPEGRYEGFDPVRKAVRHAASTSPRPIRTSRFRWRTCTTRDTTEWAGSGTSSTGSRIRMALSI